MAVSLFRFGKKMAAFAPCDPLYRFKYGNKDGSTIDSVMETTMVA
jgi:hypothetical protein